MTGVGATPRSITSWPQAMSAEITPSRIMTPLARGSRPIITAPGEPRKVPNAAAKSMTCAAVRPVPTTPRRPTCEMRSDFNLFHELQPPERVRDVIGRSVGRLPGNALADWPGALQPVEIDAHLTAGL